MLASLAFASYALLTIGLLWLMKPVKSNFLDGLLLRAASATALAAGFLGAQGLIGDWISSGLGIAGDASAQLFGGSVLGLVGMGIGIWIVLLWLPNRYYDQPVNQSAVLLGFLVPALVAQFPGPLGRATGQILHFFANMAMIIVGGATG